MRVLMFGWEFPPHITGGLGTACFGLTKSMSGKGADILFVMPKVNYNESVSHVTLMGPDAVGITHVSETEEEFSHLKKVVEFDANLHPYMNEDLYQEKLDQVKNKTHKIEKTKKPMEEGFKGGYGINLMSEVARFSSVGYQLGEDESFDIIHAHDWMTFLAAIEAKKQSGKPLVVHVHATEFDRTGDAVNPDIFRIEQLGMQEADRVIAVSYRTKDMIVNKYGIDESKVIVVHNGVEMEKRVDMTTTFRPFPGDRIVLFLGRITMQKGPEYFVQAASEVVKAVPNVRFVMAGSGDMTRKMIEKSASLKLAEKFHFTGFLGEATREKMFSMSDLYVMPSVSEPFGITPLEALKHEVPVIISKQSGIAEVLDNVIKVDFWDVKELAKSIVNVLTDSKLGEELVKRSETFLPKMGWDKPADEILGIYDELI